MTGTRDLIIDVAEAAFAERPYPVAMDGIARRAGVSRSTVYRHFPDRFALATAVAERWVEPLRSAEGGPDGLRELLAGMMSSLVRMGPVTAQLRELAPAELRRRVRCYEDLVAPALRRLQDAGRLRPEIEPSDVSLLFEMLNTVLDAADSPQERERRAGRAIPLLLNGLFQLP